MKLEATPEILSRIANLLRIHSIRSTTAAGSGHPTSCCSSAELIAALFFGHMRFDAQNPHYTNNDRFILSKGHAAPILYAAWAETGHFPPQQLDTLRKLNSPFEGHPTPRLDFVDAATGSLGQGLSIGVGMAIHSKMHDLSYRTYVLLGDGELSEGSVWEAASLAGVRKLNRLIGIADINRYGQSQETAFGHDMKIYQSRFEAFGWKTIQIDGHNISEILHALSLDTQTHQPLMILAKTIKGKGIPFAEDKNGWHGKPLSPEQAQEVISQLQPHAQSAIGLAIAQPAPIKAKPPSPKAVAAFPPPEYKGGEEVSTRKAYGNALSKVGGINERVIVLDGDVENSTYSQEFAHQYSDRFIECYISEQNMIGISIGLSAMGDIPFPSTFGAFFCRALDQIRMAGISRSHLKITGSHAGVSIGEDGPSQMALEDLATMRVIPESTVFYPCDAVSTEKLVHIMAETPGMFYLRTTRSQTPLLYSTDEAFQIGGAKILKQSPQDQVTVIAAGVTVFEALRAAESLIKQGISITVIDAYCVKPLARDLILSAAQKTNQLVITVEDHYPQGGLGDAVAGELSQYGVKVHKLAVYEIPVSGEKNELLAKYKINSQAIQDKVKELIPSQISVPPLQKAG